MSTRTVALSSKELDSAIEVLSSARQALQLTPFERFSYQALILSVDWIAVCFLIQVGDAIARPFGTRLPGWFVTILGLAMMLGVFVGILSLALNIPLFRRVFRERARLKELGLSSLSRSLWKSRRKRWISLAHGTLLTVAGIVYSLMFSAYVFLYINGQIHFQDRFDISLAILSLLFGVTASLLFAVRYLKNQRERMELTTNAEGLRKAFQSLRQRAGVSKVVTVPSQLLEQTAKIESAQIAEERKDAILESVTSRPTGYAIAFDRDAAEQRATLDVADRIELGDLVAQLSTDGTQLEPRESVQRDKTKGNRVEIDYVIDDASRSIRVIAVRRVHEVSHASVNGGSHA